jgi:hypothetical protein
MLLNTISNVDAIFISKYLHSVVEERPPYHPPLGRHPFPGLEKKHRTPRFPAPPCAHCCVRPGAGVHPSQQRVRGGAGKRGVTPRRFGIRYNLVWTQRRMEISAVQKPPSAPRLLRHGPRLPSPPLPVRILPRDSSYTADSTS